MGAGLVISLLGVVMAAASALELLVPLLLLAGALPPPVGPLMRASWRHLSGADQALLARAYAVDVVSEDLIFLVGPLVAAPCVAWLGATQVLLGSALILMAAATAQAASAPRAARTSPCLGACRGKDLAFGLSLSGPRQ